MSYSQSKTPKIGNENIGKRYRQNSMRNMIRSSARSRSLLKHAGDVFSLKVALDACYLADTSGTTIPNRQRS